MNVIDKLKEGLNLRQLEAVTETEGFVRVIAGAGSGKTKALASRFAYIVEALGVNSSNILCVTFTNKAAQEMKKRVKLLIGQDADVSLIVTYHGFCVKVLREDINKIHYPQKFIILDTEDQKSILREIYEELAITSKEYTFKDILRYISARKGNEDYLKFILEGYIPPVSDDVRENIFYRYIQKQQRNFALDFDDLMIFTLCIFNKYADILEKWQRRLHYIQVDETQDSSDKQFDLVKMLSKYHGNLFVVGDPDQTIYEWRGANLRILVDFDKQFENSKTVLMNQNYRSTPNILNLGNHIIKNNKIRFDKDMFTDNESGVDIVHFHGKSEFEESLWIANEVKALIALNKANAKDIAVLYRAHFISRSIEQALIKENIPYTIYGGIRFFERKEIKDILSYLRLIAFGDNMSFLRIINSPKRGLGKKFISKLTKLAEDSNNTIYETLLANIDNPEFKKGSAIKFINLINKFRNEIDKVSISDFTKIMLDESGLTEYYRTDGDTDRLDNLKEFLNSMLILEKENQENILLNDYLQDIALYTDMDNEEDNRDRVKLMTIHTSKGLEFPYVFLAGFSEDILPSANSKKERRENAIEEERRLAYVAITRAEKGFYMTESEGYNFSTGLNKYPSRFLFEISEEFYVRKGYLDIEIINSAKSIIANDKNKKNADTSAIQNFTENDIVIHPIWNKGKVLSVNLHSGEYIVHFIEQDKIKHISFNFKLLEKYIEPLSEELQQEKDQAARDWEMQFNPDFNNK